MLLIEMQATHGRWTVLPINQLIPVFDEGELRLRTAFLRLIRHHEVGKMWSRAIH